jgi:catechol 2,3-dioxygenase-like lactoylglutathione lyase family enzyme
MPTYHFDHIHLNSPDAVKTAQFYENMFGAKIVRIRPRPEGSSVRLDLNGEVAMIGPPGRQPAVSARDAAAAIRPDSFRIENRRPGKSGS